MKSIQRSRDFLLYLSLYVRWIVMDFFFLISTLTDRFIIFIDYPFVRGFRPNFTAVVDRKQATYKLPGHVSLLKQIHPST